VRRAKNSSASTAPRSRDHRGVDEREHEGRDSQFVRDDEQVRVDHRDGEHDQSKGGAEPARQAGRGPQARGNPRNGERHDRTCHAQRQTAIRQAIKTENAQHESRAH
jgi:hypothetical protein